MVVVYSYMYKILMRWLYTTTSTTTEFVRTLAVWPAAAPMGLPTYHFPLHHVLQPFALPPPCLLLTVTL